MTMMDSKKWHNDKIRQAIRDIPETEAPEWLDERIMRAISAQPRNTGCSYRRPVRAVRSHVISAVRVLVVVLLCGGSFWGGMHFVSATGDLPEITAGQLPRPGDLVDPQASFLLGRGMLAAGNEELALSYFHQAVQLDPTVAEYSYWTGIAYWRLGNMAEERQSYGRVLQQSPEYIPSLLNLGHNLLQQGEYAEAVAQYDTVLKHAPGNPRALYNKALASLLLGQDAAAEQGFMTFLQTSRQGKWAERAVQHLERFDNFRFRSFRVGAAYIVFDVQALLTGSKAEQMAEIALLDEAVQRAGECEVHFVVYAENDLARAKYLANDLKEEVLATAVNTGLDLKTSWFDAPLEIDAGQGRKKSLAESLLIFTRAKKDNNGRSSI